MSPEREAEIRSYVEAMKLFIVDGGGPDMRATLIKEIDAEREAHKRTQAERDRARQAVLDLEAELEAHATNRAKQREQLADLETRLALTKSSRDWNREQLRHSREVWTSLKVAAIDLIDASQDARCADFRIVVERMHAAIALTERDSNAAKESA